jgi:hypothetical protein
VLICSAAVLGLLLLVVVTACSPTCHACDGVCVSSVVHRSHQRICRAGPVPHHSPQRSSDSVGGLDLEAGRNSASHGQLMLPAWRLQVLLPAAGSRGVWGHLQEQQRQQRQQQGEQCSSGCHGSSYVDSADEAYAFARLLKLTTPVLCCTASGCHTSCL